MFMNQRFQEALQAHRVAMDAAEAAAEARRGPLSPVGRRIARHRAKVAPKYQLVPFNCSFCMERAYHWGDQPEPVACKRCRKWI